MLMKFINHYKKLLQAVNLAFSWLVKRFFCRNLRVNDKSAKAALKKLLQGKNAQFVAHFSKQGLSKG